MCVCVSGRVFIHSLNFLIPTIPTSTFILVRATDRVASRLFREFISNDYLVCISLFDLSKEEEIEKKKKTKRKIYTSRTRLF